MLTVLIGMNCVDGSAKAAPPPLTQPAATQEAIERFGERPAPQFTPKPPFADGEFNLGDGEVVIFAGQTNMVRAQQTGYLESQLAAHWATRKPRFRSMAWEGDTVYQQWRDMNFGGWHEQLAWAGAGVVIAQFGQTESLDGDDHIDTFVAAYGRLIDQFATVTRRIVLISPMPFEKPAAPFAPNLRTRNADVRAYAEATRKLAAERGCIFVDLFSPLTRRSPRTELTGNGMHLTPKGQEIVADIIARQLGAEPIPDDRLEPLRLAIVDKNALWFNNWRPTNWAFAYGDRQQVPFGHPGGGRPALRVEFEEFKPLIAKADDAIHVLALEANPHGK
jgi:hypothetical protein